MRLTKWLAYNGGNWALELPAAFLPDGFLSNIGGDIVKFSTSSILICAALSAALPCAAQQSSGTTPAPAAPAASAPASDAAATAPAAAPTAAQTPASSADQGAPSADLIKRAKGVGMRPETRGGKTVFCWEDSNTGTRFPTKKCTDEAGVEAMIAQRESAKQTMRQTMSGTSAH